MAMDVSWDGIALASESADKFGKIWGVDFGDCRKSLRSRAQAVTSELL